MSTLGKKAAPVQSEEGDRGLQEVTATEGGEEECRHNGDGGHDASLGEGEAKPEEEHNGNGSADSPSEEQQ